MQDQVSFDSWLRIQCLLQGSDSKVAGNVPICDACDNAPVMQVDNAAVIPYVMILQKQIGKIGTPFLIDLVSTEVLL